MTWDQDDLAIEGDPEVEFDVGVAARQPRHRIASGALVRNSVGDVLMVQPVYKPTWEIPGGIVEDDETPLGACQREIREELGVDLPLGRLLVVDSVPRQGAWSDLLLFVFDGLVVRDPVTFTLPEDELMSARFVPLEEASSHVRPSMARRLVAAVSAATNGETRYLHFGRPVA